jgi:alpha-mannosidase
MRLLITFLLSSLILNSSAQSYIPGYQSTLAGEELQYHSPQPDANVSLLVRSEDSARYIEWESTPLLPSSPGLPVSSSPLLLLAGIDVNPGDPHRWKVYINDRPFFTIASPADTLSKILTWPGPDGSSLVFRVSEVDKYGDFMGYLFCNLPASLLETGKPVRFRVVGESAGSRTWFMVFKYAATDKVGLFAEQAIMRGTKGNSQVLRAEIVHYADPVEVKIDIAGKKLRQTLGFGYNVLYLPVRQFNSDTNVKVVIRSGKNTLADELFLIQPVEQRTIYLLHHSHNDIGYTDVQPEVEKKQWANLDNAIRIAGDTKDFPPGSQLKWCTEVMWAVESYYDKASPEKKDAFQEAVKTGRIELNGLFANELTSLCGPEELDRLLEAGRRITRECGVNLTSAMITDIPGWTWAIVPALANSGVKYFSIGTNRGHRIGNILEAWGDRPFYWVSPSAEEKVLCWIHGEGYSLFHTGLAYSSIRKRLQEDLIFNYLAELSEKNYPYEEVMLRYNIGSDNGPVDETLPQAVKEWNEKYITPQIKISTVEEAFSAFEKKHKDDLPEVSGDLTGYWEDGAFSTTRETIMNRRNASRLTQAQALWAMFNPLGYPEEKIMEAWRNVLLFDEHTWGSWNSVSEPDSPFTLQQWEIKKSFALEADNQSKKLLFDAMLSKVLGGPAADAVEVINTCSWARTGLVTVTGGIPGSQVSMVDRAGNETAVQILSDGTMAFIARDIPAFGSKIFKISRQQDNAQTIVQSSNRPIVQSNQFESANFSLTIDTTTGAVSSLILKKTGANLVDTSRFSGINEYLYIDGRLPDHPLLAKFREVTVLEEGPVLKTLRVVAAAPGCDSIITDIRIMDELNLVEIVNKFEKQKVISPEAIHIAFPFKIRSGRMKYDLAYGYCRPDLDQLPGSNRNFLAMEHWIDISDEKSGVTVICPDAPLFEAGKITMDELVYGWVDFIPATQTFFSYLMNNYWETNYSASQEGLVSVRYIMVPHDGFDPADAEKAAISQRQPLITRKGGGWLTEKSSLLKLKNDHLIITAIKPVNQGKDIIISLYNPGPKEEIPAWETSFKAILITGPDGLTEKNFDGNSPIPSGGIRYYKLTL